MIVLGIDPGYAITGWAALRKRKSKIEVIDYGCIYTEKDIEHTDRLLLLHTELSGIIKKYKPKIGVVEDIFFYKNVKTALKVGQARGVILLTCIQNNLDIYEFTPLQVKQALVGYGRADKMQVQKMVKLILGLDKIPKPDDAADALAVAVTYIHAHKFLEKTKKK